jgi:hypothetical protein
MLLVNSSRAFDWYMNCHTLTRKNYGQFLHKGGGGRPLPKKYPNFFLSPDMKIHIPIESPARVDKKHVVFKSVYNG